jgi:hypothetical protein
MPIAAEDGLGPAETGASSCINLTLLEIHCGTAAGFF